MVDELIGQFSPVSFSEWCREQFDRFTADPHAASDDGDFAKAEIVGYVQTLPDDDANRPLLVMAITSDYVSELISQSEGHPYVIKILLGEVSHEKRIAHIPRLLAGCDEILTALFERTYASLTPCAQRAFLTLAAWNSAVPRIAIEAVLHRSVEERCEVEQSVETLLQYSLAERQESMDGQEFIALPLVAGVFGKRKLKISPLQPSIRADVEMLQMLGPVARGEIHFSLEKRIEHFLGVLAHKSEMGESLDGYMPILEMMGQKFPRTWLLMARLYMEQQSLDGYQKAKVVLNRYLERESESQAAVGAWRDLAHCCFKTGDMLGDIHAFIQRCKIASVSFHDLANTAKLLNDLLKKEALGLNAEEKRILGEELLSELERRRSEAVADDFGQMAWLALRLRSYDRASEFVRLGLKLEPGNPYLKNLAEQPNIRL